jgi:hypothetical protein
VKIRSIGGYKASSMILPNYDDRTVVFNIVTDKLKKSRDGKNNKHKGYRAAKR